MEVCSHDAAASTFDALPAENVIGTPRFHGDRSCQGTVSMLFVVCSLRLPGCIEAG
jgi:hypothetical protein